MSKKKKIILGTIAALLLGGGGYAIYYYFFYDGHQGPGIDQNLVTVLNKEGHTSLDDDRVLVIYFSSSGNTQLLANQISDIVGGDLRRIEPVKEYPSKYQDAIAYAKTEQKNNERPEYKPLNINIDDYDTIFIGYPIWWNDLPQMMYTFFDQYDLSDKTIIPFNTHEGSGDAGTYETIQKLEPNAKVLEGIALKGRYMQEDQSEVIKEWLTKLNIEVQ